MSIKIEIPGDYLEIFFVANGECMWKFGRILQFLVANATISVAMYSVDHKCYIQLSQSHPMPAKFQHVTNIETCTLLCCNHITLWKAWDANMVENGARCSDKNVKILHKFIPARYQWIG